MSRYAVVIPIAVALVFAAPVTEAAQRVHFKNGHVLVVESAKEDGNVVFLKLADGSEVGFPKALIEKVEGGKHLSVKRPERANRGHAVRGHGLSSLPGYERARAKAAAQGRRESRMESGFNAGSATDTPARVGYSRFGSGRDARRNANSAATTQVNAHELRRRAKQRDAMKGNPTVTNGEQGEGLNPVIAVKVADTPASRAEADE